MSRTVQTYVEVDLSEFEDDDIMEEAETRAGRFGTDEQSYRRVHDLAAAIAAGDTKEALHRLDDLIGDTQRLRDAADLGRRAGLR